MRQSINDAHLNAGISIQSTCTSQLGTVRWSESLWKKNEKKAMHITFVFYYRSACLNLPSRTSILFTYGCHAQPPSASGNLLDFKTCYIPIQYSRRKNLGAYSQVKNGQAGSYFKITGNLICPRFFPHTAMIFKEGLNVPFKSFQRQSSPNTSHDQRSS